jgi:signal transduction histidine kinase
VRVGYGDRGTAVVERVDQPVASELADLRAWVTRVTSTSLAVLTVVLVLVTFTPVVAELGSTATTLLIGGTATAYHLGVACLPWGRLARGPHGQHAVSAYLAVTVALICTTTLAAGTTAALLLWPLTLTTAHAAATLTVRGQVVAYLGTVAGVSTAAALGAALVPFDLVFALATLGAVAVLFGRLCGRYVRTLQQQAEVAQTADRAARRIRALGHAAPRLTAADPTEVLDAVVETAQLLGYPTASVYEHDPVGRTIRYVAAAGFGTELRGSVFDDDVGVAGRVVASGRTEVIERYPEHPRANPAFLDTVQVALGSPIRDETGAITGILVCGRPDPTPVTAEDLEVFELLAAHASRALTVARGYTAERRRVVEMAELDRLKSDFLSTVSHELRTPLTVVTGLSQTLEMRWPELEEDAKLRLFARLRANAVALDDVIATLLDFSRIESGTLETRIAPFCLAHAVRTAVARLEPLTVAHEVTVDAPERAPVQGDVRLVDRVVENLLTNAVRHTAAGTSVELRVAAGRRVTSLAVIDTGEGMSAEDLARVGERFFRGGDVETRSTRGVGLGLALVEEVLHRHDTDLTVTSRRGHGTTFSFALPTAADVPPGLG